MFFEVNKKIIIFSIISLLLVILVNINETKNSCEVELLSFKNTKTNLKKINNSSYYKSCLENYLFSDCQNYINNNYSLILEMNQISNSCDLDKIFDASEVNSIKALYKAIIYKLLLKSIAVNMDFSLNTIGISDLKDICSIKSRLYKSIFESGFSDQVILNFKESSKLKEEKSQQSLINLLNRLNCEKLY